MAKKKETTEAVNTININGNVYELDKLPEQVKSLLNVYTQWQQDRELAIKALGDAKMEVAKNEAALRDLSAEIIVAVETPASLDTDLA